jgi:glucosamine-6-phosphate deaminase
LDVIITKDAAEMCQTAAQMIADLVRAKPDCVLGLATGSTPIPMYKELIRMHREEGLDFSRVTTFNLDEYYPIKPTHNQSYRYFMNHQLFDHINIRNEATHVPDGQTQDLEGDCARYEDMIREAGGIDIQVLGIGSNGHIGFNEPGSAVYSRTRLVVLTERTIQDNSRFFDSLEEVPRFALTMGIGTILDARRSILLANGTHKTEAVARLVEGPITSMCPASALQLQNRATVIVDTDAGAKLTRKDYYAHVRVLLAQVNPTP